MEYGSEVMEQSVLFLIGQIDAKKAVPPEQYKEQQLKNLKTCKIFCGGVPTDMEKDKIDEYFKQFGEVSQCLFYCTLMCAEMTITTIEQFIA